MRALRDKPTLRRELKERLENLRADARKWECSQQEVSAQLRSFLEKLLVDRKSPFILGTFAPLPDEPAWPLAFGTDGKWWSDHGCATAFPRPAGEGSMSFHRAQVGELVTDNGFGVPILVPRSEAPLVVPDALLVPALGLGPEGERLGRGKGYYDRYLGLYRGLKIGIALEEMVVENIPTDPHDVNMDVVVTSKRILRISKSP